MVAEVEMKQNGFWNCLSHRSIKKIITKTNVPADKNSVAVKPASDVAHLIRSGT